MAKSQTITNVQAKQDGNNVIITYKLQCDRYASISLFVSESNGANFKGPLKSVRGDVGNDIKSGNKTITWNALLDQDIIASDNIVFRIVGLPKFGIMTDNRDGKTYNTVRIENQIIMTENLAYKPDYGNYWTYNNDINYLARYGYLYDWQIAKNVCPSGWHLPTKEEFNILLNLTGVSEKNKNYTLRTRDAEFKPLLGGYRTKIGDFIYLGASGGYWSNTTLNDAIAWSLYWTNNGFEVIFYDRNIKCGFSVRCIQDK